MKERAMIEVVRDLSRPFRVTKGKHFRLKDVDPNDTLSFPKEGHKPRAQEALALGVGALADLQTLWSAYRRSDKSAVTRELLQRSFQPRRRQRPVRPKLSHG